jgi:hypothetical protein
VELCERAGVGDRCWAINRAHEMGAGARQESYKSLKILSLGALTCSGRRKGQQLELNTTSWLEPVTVATLPLPLPPSGKKQGLIMLTSSRSGIRAEYCHSSDSI